MALDSTNPRCLTVLEDQPDRHRRAGAHELAQCLALAPIPTPGELREKRRLRRLSSFLERVGRALCHDEPDEDGMIDVPAQDMPLPLLDVVAGALSSRGYKVDIQDRHNRDRERSLLIRLPDQ